MAAAVCLLSDENMRVHTHTLQQIPSIAEQNYFFLFHQNQNPFLSVKKQNRKNNLVSFSISFYQKKEKKCQVFSAFLSHPKVANV